MNDRKTGTRRGFLLGTTAAAGAAAVAAATGAAPSKVDSTDRSGADDKASKGYRLTEHVRRYYRTTMI